MQSRNRSWSVWFDNSLGFSVVFSDLNIHSFHLGIITSSCVRVLWEEEIASWDSGMPKCGHGLHAHSLSWCRADGEAAGFTAAESQEEVDDHYLFGCREAGLPEFVYMENKS